MVWHPLYALEETARIQAVYAAHLHTAMEYCTRPAGGTTAQPLKCTM